MLSITWRLRTRGVDKRINKLEDNLEKLKRGVLNVSKVASCQVGGVIEDAEKEPRDESLDNSCLLAVEFAANIVAKGTIMKYSASGKSGGKTCDVDEGDDMEEGNGIEKKIKKKEKQIMTLKRRWTITQRI
ncbi:unnamed protein product [Lactuca saligna]|uniref:Uncharacterized protein n=1 Tax=Lactuca saligna TaxID=75948 RepID=A0AA36EH51_LACSI|nr:unnamed protein product [Lactuca saligna]